MRIKDINWYREYWKEVRSNNQEYPDPNSYDDRDPNSIKGARYVTPRDHVYEEVLDELERVYAILDNIEGSQPEEIVKLLYEMPWTRIVVHGGANGGDQFSVCDWTKAGTSYLSEDISAGVDLYKVLKEAKDKKWRYEK